VVAGAHAKADGDMAFPGSGLSQDQHGTGFVDKAELMKVFDLFDADGRLELEIKLIHGLLLRELCFLDPPVRPAVQAVTQLLVDQVGQKPHIPLG
jgi:hypothetical protein